MNRRFVAIIELDENTALNNCAESGTDYAPGEYFEKEFCWTELSGLSLEEWMIMDSDDESRWARYRNYLIHWALNHAGEEYDGMSPACYDEWCDQEDD